MGMMDVGEMKRLYEVKQFEFWIAMAALLGVMTFGILQGVVIGVVLSLIWLIAVSSLPYIPELGRKKDTEAFYDLKNHPDGETYPGLAIVRFDGGLFFVNSGALSDQLREIRIREGSGLNGVILSMEGVDFIDTEGADAIKTIAEAGNQYNIDLHLARVKAQVLEVLERDGALDIIGPDRIHADIATAVKMHLGKYPSDAATEQ
jgi:MFS superfamily sulfate permease-like transporter